MENILEKYAHSLTIETKARNKLLPDYLSVREIVQLWRPEPDIRRALEQTILDAVWSGVFSPMRTDEDREVVWYSRFPRGNRVITLWTKDLHIRIVWTAERPSGASHWLIHRDRFKGWLIEENEWPLPDDNLLKAWWPDDASGTNHHEKPLTGKRAAKAAAKAEVLKVRDRMLSKGMLLEDIADSPEIVGIYRRHRLECPALGTIRNMIKGPGKPGAPKKS